MQRFTITDSNFVIRIPNLINKYRIESNEWYAASSKRTLFLVIFIGYIYFYELKEGATKSDL
jgi:hypothetical protein